MFVFGAMLYVQLWVVAAEDAYAIAAALYNFRPRNPIRLNYLQPSRVPEHPTGFQLAARSLWSYLLTIYGYAIAFSFLSRRNPAAFNVPHLSIFDGIYFSLIMAATVGYGDIVPVSTTARFLVMTEILVAFIYVIFLFSILASAVRDLQPRAKEIEIHSPPSDND